MNFAPLRRFLYKLVGSIGLFLALSSVVVVAFGVRLKYGGPISLNFLKPYVTHYTRSYGVKNFTLDVRWKERWDFLLTLKDVQLQGITACEINATLSAVNPSHIKDLVIKGAEVNIQELMASPDSKETKINLLSFFSFPMRCDDLSLVFFLGKDRIRYSNLFLMQEQGKIKIQHKNNGQKKDIGHFTITPQERHLVKITGTIQELCVPIKGPWKGFPLLTLGGEIHGSLDPLITKDSAWSVSFSLMQKKGTWFDLVSEHMKTHISRATLKGTIDHKKGGKIDGSVWVNQGQFHLHSTVMPLPEGISLTARIHLEGTLAVEDLKGVWPEAVSPSARRWLIANFRKGTIHKSVCDLKGIVSSQGFNVTDVKGNIGINALSLSFMPDMPHLTQVKALSWFDLDKFLVQVKSGQCSGHTVKGYVKITPLSGLPKLYLDVALEGPFAPLFPLLLKFASIGDAPITHIKGKDKTRIKGEFPLLNELKREQVGLTLESSVSEAAFEVKAFSKNLQIAQGNIVIRGGQKDFSIEGKTLVNAVPSQWKFQKDRLTFSGTPSLAHIKTLTDFDLSAYCSGPLQLKGVYTPQKTEVTLDLTKNTCTLPWIMWNKKAQTPLTVGAHYGQGKLIFHANGGAQAKGECVFDKQGKLSKVEATCTVGENFAQYRYENHHHRVFFEGPSVDLTQNSEKAPSPAPSDKIKHPAKSGSLSAPSPLDQLSLHFACRELKMKTATLQGCRVRLNAQESKTEKALLDPLHWRVKEGNIFAIIKRKNSPKRGYLSATFTPSEQNSTDIIVDVTDSGALLSGLDITQKIRSGALSLRARQTQKETFSGEIKIANVETKAPVMLKLLSLVSPTLFMELFSSGITFHEIRGKFRYDNGKLFIEQGVGKGINLGIFVEGEIDTNTSVANLDGVVVPSYFFNTVFSYLPVLGWIFGGEKGIISSEFVLKGPLTKPQIGIKPFSLFKLGFIKNILEQIEHGQQKK